MDAIERDIRAFLNDSLPPMHDGEIAADASLFEAGVLDSIGVLGLVTWLERTFDIRVDDREIVPENIDGIARLVAYVRDKRAEAGHAE